MPFAFRNLGLLDIGICPSHIPYVYIPRDSLHVRLTRLQNRLGILEWSQSLALRGESDASRAFVCAIFINALNFERQKVYARIRV